MRIKWTIGMLVGTTVLAATSVGAAELCRLGNQAYPENAVVCSQGLVIYCANGTWQSSDGARCDVSSGEYLTPLRPYQEKSNEPIPEYFMKNYPGLGSK